MGVGRASAAAAANDLEARVRELESLAEERAREIMLLRSRMMELETVASERHNTLRALRESEERLRTILEHAPVMIDSFDADGRVLLWNRECERTLGVSKEEIAEMEDPLAI